MSTSGMEVWPTFLGDGRWDGRGQIWFSSVWMSRRRLWEEATILQGVAWLGSLEVSLRFPIIQQGGAEAPTDTE